MNFLNSIKDDWNTKTEWIDVKNTQNGPILLRETKTWGKRLIYQILSLATLGFWKKRRGIERVIKEMKKIAKSQNIPVVPYDLELRCITKLYLSTTSRDLKESLNRVDELAQRTCFKAFKKLIQELSDPSLNETNRIERIRELAKNIQYLGNLDDLHDLGSIRWSDNPSDEEKAVLLVCYKNLHTPRWPPREVPLSESDPRVINLTERAARLGDANACFFMGRQLYSKSKYGDPSLKPECLTYLLKAARAGHLDALSFLKEKWYQLGEYYTLAKFYAEPGAHQDIEQSFEFLSWAANRGDQKALEELENGENLSEALRSKRYDTLGMYYLKERHDLQKALYYLKKTDSEINAEDTFQTLLTLARLIEKSQNLKGEEAKELFNKCMADCKKIADFGLRMEGYALCHEILAEKEPLCKVTLGRESFELKFEEKEILLDLSKEVQRQQSGRWETQHKDTLDLTQKSGLTEENLRRFLRSIRTGQIEEINEAIEHVMIAEELEMPALKVSYTLIRDVVWFLDDLESAKALTECVKTTRFPKEIVDSLAIYWCRVFEKTLDPSERSEIIQTLIEIHPSTLYLDSVSYEEMVEILKMKNLLTLSLSGPQNEKVFIELRKLKNLTCLYLNACGTLSDEALKSILDLKNLEMIHLRNCSFNTQEGLASLGKLEKLWFMELREFASLRGISALKNLGHLRCGNIKEVNLEEMKEIGSLKKLNSLELYGPWVNDEMLRQVGSMDLFRITLGKTSVSQEALSSLKWLLPQLEVKVFY